MAKKVKFKIKKTSKPRVERKVKREGTEDVIQPNCRIWNHKLRGHFFNTGNKGV